MSHGECWCCSIMSVHIALFHGENNWENMALEYFPMYQINNNLKIMPKEKKKAHLWKRVRCVSVLHFTIAAHHIYEDIINSRNRKRVVRIK